VLHNCIAVSSTYSLELALSRPPPGPASHLSLDPNETTGLATSSSSYMPSYDIEECPAQCKRFCHRNISSWCRMHSRLVATKKRHTSGSTWSARRRCPRRTTKSAAVSMPLTARSQRAAVTGSARNWEVILIRDTQDRELVNSYTASPPTMPTVPTTPITFNHVSTHPAINCQPSIRDLPS